jgi:hypothetical protein
VRSESEGWDWNFEGRRGKQQAFRRQRLKIMSMFLMGFNRVDPERLIRIELALIEWKTFLRNPSTSRCGQPSL